MPRSDSHAVQDYYAEDAARCFGCGRLNAHGHGLRTQVVGEETLAHFTPCPDQCGMPGYVYGGLLASLIDCHAMATAAAAAVRAAGRDLGDGEMPRFVTASLTVDYLRPTPLGPVLEIRGRVRERGDRKTVVEASVWAEGRETVRGRVVAVPLPGSMRG